MAERADIALFWLVGKLSNKGSNNDKGNSRGNRSIKNISIKGHHLDLCAMDLYQ